MTNTKQQHAATIVAVTVLVMVAVGVVLGLFRDPPGGCVLYPKHGSAGKKPCFDYKTQPPEDRKTQPPEDHKTQPPEDRKTQPPEDRKTQPPEGVPAAREIALPPVAMPMGYVPHPEATRQYLEDQGPQGLIRGAAPHLFEARPVPGSTKQGVFLYRPLHKQWREKYGREFVVGQQAIGDCVSWGWAHGCGIAWAVSAELGESSGWDMPATEPIYGGSRQMGGMLGGGDGSYGSAAAKYVSTFGILWRRPYDFGLDLSRYSGSRAKEFGRYGFCGNLTGEKRAAAEREAKTFPVLTTALCQDFAEAAAAIKSGYPVPVCSNQGFSAIRDKEGYCHPQGTWAHCMCFIAFRGEPRPGLLCLNSWGPKSVSGPKFPDDQPDGSFWVDAAACTRMLSGRDSFAVSAVKGFPFRDLSNGDWVRVCRPEQAPRSSGDAYQEDVNPCFADAGTARSLFRPTKGSLCP